MKQLVTVKFEDGNSLSTTINGTRAEVTAYYVGQTFNLGNGGEDHCVKAVSVEFTPTFADQLEKNILEYIRECKRLGDVCAMGLNNLKMVVRTPRPELPCAPAGNPTAYGILFAEVCNSNPEIKNFLI